MEQFVWREQRKRISLWMMETIPKPSPVESHARHQCLELELQRLDLILEGARNETAESELERIAGEIKRIEEEISLLESKAPLDEIVSRCGLNPLERDILVLCFARALDTKYGGIFAALQEEPGKSYATMSLIFRLFGEKLNDVRDIRNALNDGAPLLSFDILRFADDPFQRSFPALDKPIEIDEHMVDLLLGSLTLDPVIGKVARMEDDAITAQSLYTTDVFERKLRGIAASWSNSGPVLIPCLRGEPGSGRRESALFLANLLQKLLLCLSLSGLVEESLDVSVQVFLNRLNRETRLFGLTLYIPDIDFLHERRDSSPGLFGLIAAFLETCDAPIILGANRNFDSHSIPVRGRTILDFDVPECDYDIRRRVWSDLAEEAEVPSSTLDEIAAKFILTPGKIRIAFDLAKAFVDSHDGMEPVLGRNSLVAGCIKVSNRALENSASRLASRYGWEDIVLPETTMTLLQDACLYVQNQDRVYSSLNFSSRSGAGRGLKIMFSGPPGTGKTMAAEVMASELGLAVYRIDLSTVISKYIGETEKNISRIFRDATSSNAILFFDEADALFSKRSEVNDSRDRYANAEVGHLLQKMEEYVGVTILATNLSGNIDEAFIRRLQFIVEFAPPRENERHRIWSLQFSSNTPMDADLDLELCAKTFKFTGSNIRNVAVHAAFLASRVQEPISMRHITIAARREYEKEGRTLMDSSLTQWEEQIESTNKND